jgi:hypothetical protein
MTTERDALWAVIEARDETIARYEAAYPGLIDKQRVLDELAAAASEREKLIDELHVEFRRREQATKELQAALDEARSVKTLNASLIEKEAVIAEQAKALAAYRATFRVVGIFVVPLNHFVLGVRSVWRRTLGRFGPKLGILHQHPPQPLRVVASTAVVPQPAPRISIVTPSFRQAVFIERTLKSVIEQATRTSSTSCRTAARRTARWRFSRAMPPGSPGGPRLPTTGNRRRSTAPSPAPRARSWPGSTPTTSSFPARSPASRISSPGIPMWTSSTAIAC